MTVFIAVLALHVLVIGGFTVYHLMGSGSDADLTLDKTHKLRADGTVVTDTTTPDATAPDKTADATASTDTATTPAATGTSTAATGSTTGPDASATATDTATPAATAPATPAPAPTQVAANPPATTAPAATETKPASAPIVLSGDDMAQTSTIPPGLAPPPDQPAAGTSPAPAPSSPAVASASTPAEPSAPAFKEGPASVGPPAPPLLSSAAPSGPVTSAREMANGPVHMPANPPRPSSTENVASHEEHASAPAHEEHAVASTHEAKKEYYTVKMTDTYKKIAETHHVTVAELKSANHIKGTEPMHTGEKLVIPSSRTLLAKSEKTHERPADVSAMTASLSASPEAGAAMPRHHFYTVSKGDTLAYIAKKFDVTVLSLKDANGVTSTKQLRIGEKIRIPLKESRSAETASIQPVRDRVAAPVAAPAPIQPSQVETQAAPVEQPAPTQTAAPTYEPQPTPASSPELTSLNF
ncbi:MAG TPA: LysM peptidoglycan-binding domain-containing protein [Candidatus Methylacidiphilales bacterium]|nr:LysM peptidoglycan-binding domain-containing protein [Candidatus Methylacidiphilales bacterium]